jgi:hypothetical protein
MDSNGVMKNRNHTRRSGEIFHMARRIKSLCHAPQPIANLGILLAVLLLAGCVANPIRSGPPEPVPLLHAQQELPEGRLLDLWVEIFESAPLDDDGDDTIGLSREIREAEARFIPIHLKNTLEKTGHWGAVRVVPRGATGGDLTVRGRVEYSDGMRLELSVMAYDASGELWLTKHYSRQVENGEYDRTRRGERDAFQDLYNEIANDLALLKQERDDAQLEEIRRVGELRFAADLSPHPFSGYLSEQDGHFSLVRLPAEDDPMLLRVQALRERDRMLIDTINGYYDAFYGDMWEPYESWRRYRSEEAAQLLRVEQDATRQKLLGAAAIAGAIAVQLLTGEDMQPVADVASQVMVIGGVAALQEGFDKDSEKKIHLDAMAELGDSFEAEVTPLVVNVDGEEVRLTGSAEVQYAKWRQLLRRIYAAETGLGSDVEALPDGRCGAGC